jgi:hypothetical protein
MNVEGIGRECIKTFTKRTFIFFGQNRSQSKRRSQRYGIREFFAIYKVAAVKLFLHPRSVPDSYSSLYQKTKVTPNL